MGVWRVDGINGNVYQKEGIKSVKENILIIGEKAGVRDSDNNS